MSLQSPCSLAVLLRTAYDGYSGMVSITRGIPGIGISVVDISGIEGNTHGIPGFEGGLGLRS